MLDDLDPSATPEGATTDPAATDAAPVAPEATDAELAKPHPLKEGGERFEQVIAQRNRAREELAEMRGRLDALEQERQAREAKPAPPTLTVDQMQAALDSGQINYAQAAALSAYQAKEQAKAEAVAEFETRQRTQAAVAEIDAYTAKLPALRDPGSEARAQVAAAAREIAAEMGRPITDPFVQRRALRETVGSLDKLGARARVAEVDRQRSDPTGVLTGGGAGGGPPTGPKADPMKGVPKAYVDYWRAKGLSDAQILEDAKHLTPSAIERLKAR